MLLTDQREEARLRLRAVTAEDLAQRGAEPAPQETLEVLGRLPDVEDEEAVGLFARVASGFGSWAQFIASITCWY